MNWQKGLKINLKRDIRLSGHTTFKIGGPVDYFACPRDRGELKVLIKAAKRYKIPILVIGAGSNILAGDKRIRGLVIRLSSPAFKEISINNSSVYAGSGVMLAGLLKALKECGLSGLENLAGIPGTVGGALVMNAGAWGGNIADALREVEVLDNSGKIKFLKKAAIKFGYRSSGLNRYLVLGSRFDLAKKSSRKIKNTIRLYAKRRRSLQDLRHPSAGCIFKNPAGISAGKLIDECGLSGRRIGGAAISDKHANFIVNLGRARARDVLKLMALVKKRVKKKFGINLEPEIKIWN